MEKFILEQIKEMLTTFITDSVDKWYYWVIAILIYDGFKHLMPKTYKKVMGIVDTFKEVAKEKGIILGIVDFLESLGSGIIYRYKKEKEGVHRTPKISNNPFVSAMVDRYYIEIIALAANSEVRDVEEYSTKDWMPENYKYFPKVDVEIK